MSEITQFSTSTDYVMTPDAGPEVDGDLSATLAAALVRLEDEAQRRRGLARSERRRSLGIQHDAIAKERAAARKRKIAGMIGATAQFGASVASTIGSLAGGGGKSSGANPDAASGASGSAPSLPPSQATSSAGSWANGTGLVLELGGQLTSQALNHRATMESLDAKASEASASGLEGVAQDHASSAEDAARSAERARNLLARVLEGIHAQRMAILRG
jgi:hypothetical protein